MRKIEFMKRLRLAQKNAREQITGYSKDRLSGGMANEGYAGGYLDALNDVEAMLTHGYPSDKWGFWRK